MVFNIWYFGIYLESLFRIMIINIGCMYFRLFMEFSEICFYAGFIFGEFELVVEAFVLIILNFFRSF